MTESLQSDLTPSLTPRLLSGEEIHNVISSYLESHTEQSTAMDYLLVAQDAKTYSLAFAAGEKAQKLKNEQLIREHTHFRKRIDEIEVKLNDREAENQALINALARESSRIVELQASHKARLEKLFQELESYNIVEESEKWYQSLKASVLSQVK